MNRRAGRRNWTLRKFRSPSNGRRGGSPRAGDGRGARKRRARRSRSRSRSRSRLSSVSPLRRGGKSRRNRSLGLEPVSSPERSTKNWRRNDSDGNLGAGRPSRSPDAGVRRRRGGSRKSSASPPPPRRSPESFERPSRVRTRFDMSPPQENLRFEGPRGRDDEEKECDRNFEPSRFDEGDKFFSGPYDEEPPHFRGEDDVDCAAGERIVEFEQEDEGVVYDRPPPSYPPVRFASEIDEDEEERQMMMMVRRDEEFGDSFQSGRFYDYRELESYGEEEFGRPRRFVSPEQGGDFQPRKPIWTKAGKQQYGHESVQEPYKQPEVSKVIPPVAKGSAPQPSFLGEFAACDLTDFDPEKTKLSARQWLCHFEKIADEKHWNVEEKKYFLMSRLKGFARQWFINAKIITANTSWAVLRKQLIHMFPSDMEYNSMLDLMIYRKKKSDESIAAYFNDKVAKLNSCGITGQKAVSCVIGGINSNKVVKECLYNMNFTNVDTLFEYVTKDADMVKHFAEQPAPAKAEASAKFERKDKNVKRLSPARSSSSQFSNKRPEPVRTFVPKRNQPPPQQRKEIANTATVSSQKPQQQQKGPVMYGPLGQIPTLAKFFTVIRFHGIVVDGYVDYKAEHVTLREKTAKLCNVDYKKSYTMVKTYNGSSITAIGETISQINIGKCSPISIKIYIMPDNIQAIPFIIGQTLINHPSVRFFEKDDHVYFCNIK